jgi:DNA polymerase III subunit delta'
MMASRTTRSASTGTAEPLGPDQPPVTALFQEVVGQPAAVAALRAAGRHPVHAYLFRGPPGSGKRAAARAFAAALLCPRGGCGECDVCRRTLAGTHPDFVMVERTGAALGIDEARQLASLAQRRPYEADRQVLVVADVDLALRSAPALLKTVEEPPPSTVFVLLARDVPPEITTLASRSVEITFTPVPTTVVTDWLVGRGLDAERAALVAEGAAGDLDRARLLAEDAGYAARIELWRSVPGRLDGHGASAAALARTLLDSTDEALEPLRAQHAEERRLLTDEAEATGDRTRAGRGLTERQHREERRWRTDELLAGLGVMARAYRDELVRALGTDGGRTRAERGELVGYEEAVGLITKASASLVRNPNELLLLQALLVRLGRLGD